MPEFQIRCWTEHDFDFLATDYTRDAFRAKRWGFCSDVIRAYALVSEGGLYFDTDVMLRQPLTEMLENKAFSAVEAWPSLGMVGVLSSILGSVPAHPYFVAILDHYKSLQFFDDPVLDAWSPAIYAKIAERWGFCYEDRSQLLDGGFRIYESSLFPSHIHAETTSSLAVHCCSGTWKNQYSLVSKLARKIRRPFLRRFVSS